MTKSQFVKVRVFLAIILTLPQVLSGIFLEPELLYRFDDSFNGYSNTYLEIRHQLFRQI